MQPYPSRLVQRLTLADGTVATIRPIRPEDAGIEQEFVRKLSDESRYFRFRDAARELSPRMLAQLTRVRNRTLPLPDRARGCHRYWPAVIVLWHTRPDE